MDRTSISDAEVAITFLSYGMVVYSRAMGQRTTVCYVTSSASIRRSAEAKLSFMTLDGAVASNCLVMAGGRLSEIYRHS